MRTPIGFRPVLSRFSAILVFVIAFGGAQPAIAAKAYQYYAVGNATDVVLPHPAKPSLMLMGGGPDVDEAFQWMIKKSGGGNFVVLRASGTDVYNSYIHAMGGVASVETIIIPSRDAANAPFVIARIKGAEALFIASGDQRDYINNWQNTPVQAAIQELASKNIPIGGTSAGLTIMGQYVFTALNGTISSPDALSNPFDKTITLGRNFLELPYMNDLISDAHLHTRDRMGRLLAFMARIVNDGWTNMVRSIGLDAETALLIDDGMALRVGIGSAYFLQTLGLPEVCKPKNPLTYSNIDVQRLSGNATFNMRSWAGNGGGTANYSISVVNGVLSSTQAGGAIY